MPNIFAEFILTALRFAALSIIFYLLHRPKTRLRLIPAICVMVLELPLCRVLYFASGGNYTAMIICDTILFLILAFICKTEPPNGIVRPIISALYFIGMIQLVNYIMSCYFYAFIGSVPSPFSIQLYFWKIIEGIIILLWALFYYRVSRKMTAKVPVPFSLLTIITPLAGLAVLTASTNAIQQLLEYGVNIFLYMALFGTLIVALNMCIFYLYTKLSLTHESLVFAQDISPVPPVWTKDQGLSTAFIEKYEITPREREVVEAMLQGKTDKEISLSLNIAVNTVQVHLKRIYKKTGAAGRFALSALVRGS